MPSAILLHMRSVKASVLAMPPPKAFAFGAACVERAWPVYELASQGQQWERRSVLRGALDAVWSWLAGIAGKPLSYAVECERAVVDDALPYAYMVANNLFGLLALIEKDQPYHCHLVANGNLNLIDSFLYSLLHLRYSQASEEIVDNHELSQREMTHQLEDIQLLQSPHSTALINDLRRRSAGRSIFGTYWKPEVSG